MLDLMKEYQKIQEIFKEVPEVELKVKKGKQFRFPIYMTDRLAATDIDALDLGVRSSNCLKRTGIYTIGDLCERIHTSTELKLIRNCGSTSVSEIMDHLFAYQYMLLSEDRKARYLAKVIEMNLL